MPLLSPARVLICGAGYVGVELARQLAARGHHPIALRRRPEPIEGIETVSADLSAPLTLPPNLDAIVYCAAADERSDAAYQRAYVDGVRNVIAAMKGTERLLFTSSTAVYAQDDGSIVDESSPAMAMGTARLLREGEALVHAAGGTVLRLAGIYGPGRDRIVRMVKEGTARLGSDAFGNRIHLRDCAGALAHLLELERPAPTYVGVDLAQDTLDDVYTFVARELGVPVPEVGDGDARSRGTGRKRCSSALLRASGYTFQVPSYREGYREAIDRLR
jgi:nucleoside-diphosphate-sugar epimerase